MGNPDRLRLSNSRGVWGGGSYSLEPRDREGRPLHLPSGFPTGSKSKMEVHTGYGTLLSPPNSQ